MSDIDRDELRRLLDEATPGPWKAEGSQVRGPDRVLVAAAREHSTTVDRPDALIIAAAVNALPARQVPGIEVTTADPYLTVTTTPEGKEWALGVLGSLAMPAITDGAES